MKYPKLSILFLCLWFTCCDTKQDKNDDVQSDDIEQSDTQKVQVEDEQERLRLAEEMHRQAQLKNDSAQAHLFQVKYLYELNALSCNEETVNEVKNAYGQLRERAKDFVGRKVEKRFQAYQQLFKANKREEVENLYKSGMLSTQQCQVIVDSYLKDWDATWSHTGKEINFIAAFEYARDVLSKKQ